jgi:hypothetical protein
MKNDEPWGHISLRVLARAEGSEINGPVDLGTSMKDER